MLYVALMFDTCVFVSFESEKKNVSYTYKKDWKQETLKVPGHVNVYVRNNVTTRIPGGRTKADLRTSEMAFEMPTARQAF